MSKPDSSGKPGKYPAFPALIDASSLQARIRRMAKDLMMEEKEPYFVAVLEGARVFMRGLCHHMGMAVPVYDTIKASSYGDSTVSSGQVTILKDIEGSVVGKRVALVEDIVDTGRTVEKIIKHLKELGAASVEVHTLLSKPSRRVVEVPLTSVGFEIPDEFVIGYGMDVAGRYRDLPYIALYREELDESEQTA